MRMNIRLMFPLYPLLFHCLLPLLLIVSCWMISSFIVHLWTKVHQFSLLQYPVQYRNPELCRSR